MQTALLRYRILAFTVGTLLTLLCFVGLPLTYGAGQEWVGYGWMAHGWLFVVYLLATLDLARRSRWPLIRVVWVGLAGTIPLLTFVAEHKVTQAVRAQLEPLPPAVTPQLQPEG